MKILLVDDSKILRTRLIRVISKIKGMEIVGEAETESQALRLIVKLRPDVVMLDIRLKSGSGIKVLENINKSSLKTEVIVCTNYGYPQYRRRCQELGAKYFLEKATEFEKIPRVLRKIKKGKEVHI
jgi:DNA-binding NarL/FixJ family response regulator